MKCFGPRVLSIENLVETQNYYPELYNRRDSFNLKPALIGLWQVNKDFECSINHLIEMDEKNYINKSFKLNLQIFLAH